MVRGRKPIPTNLKLLQGAPKGTINHDEPMPDDGIPTCPSDDTDIREVWDYTINQLRRMRVITMADRDPLFLYCRAIIMYRDAMKILDYEGLIVSNPSGGVRIHPAVSIADKASSQANRLATEFGMTPAARTRIKVGAQEVVKDTTAARLLSS